MKKFIFYFANFLSQRKQYYRFDWAISECSTTCNLIAAFSFLIITVDSKHTAKLSLVTNFCKWAASASWSSSNRTGWEGRPRSSGSWSACAGDGDTPSPLRRVAWDTALTPTTRTCEANRPIPIKSKLADRAPVIIPHN